MAKRICLDKRVEPLDPITGKESDFEALQDRRILVFACADPVMPTVTAPSPLAAAPAPMKSVATMLIATEVLFYFDQSDLAGMTAQGREALQKVIERLSAIAPQAVRISGYTDRIGSDAYNLALSTRRANAVKQYLQTHGVTIPIMANGYGKRTPGIDCPTPDRMRLVACLAPDRVVEIELMGRASRQ
ncbi:OmpA family protein [Burkholderia cepacia]|uniref:OmpA family protein n=1 Tax=Burkholderia cepacia TaxID=292 RepID=UPI00158D9331|nr:OmpA family protein [Burkholderia cepacia]